VSFAILSASSSSSKDVTETTGPKISSWKTRMALLPSKVITLSDCLAATSTEEHDNALKYDYPMFSKPMESATFIAELDQ
jgi:hypothetical protein